MNNLTQNLSQHVSHQPALLVVFIVSLLILVVLLPFFAKQRKLYGSPFEFAPQSIKTVAGIALTVFAGLALYSFTPYTSPPSPEIVIVLGNTQNTPSPEISQDISKAILGTMLQHKGDKVESLSESIKIISAVKNPEVISLDSFDVELKQIGNNNSNAKRSAGLNIKAIEEKLNTLAPTDNGADYLEAILEASDNAAKGSKIIVIGSGLSDSGDLNFSKTNVLVDEATRKTTLRDIKDSYKTDRLEGYEVEFYGLGDTVAPQEPLSSMQKGIVRDVYQDVIRKLGGKAKINTNTLTGASVETNYVVGTTDTGCGDINLIFDDNDLKFVGGQAIFVDKTAAIETLTTIKDLWVKQKDTIDMIQIDGYTAHYPGADSLSQERANAVKQELTNLGISNDKITATGRGFGPYQQDTQNRAVKVNISRNSEQCNN